jgi:hypothetical protein
LDVLDCDFDRSIRSGHERDLVTDGVEVGGVVDEVLVGAVGGEGPEGVDRRQLTGFESDPGAAGDAVGVRLVSTGAYWRPVVRREALFDRINRLGAICSRAFRLDLAGRPKTRQVATGRRHAQIVRRGPAQLGHR